MLVRIKPQSLKVIIAGTRDVPELKALGAREFWLVESSLRAAGIRELSTIGEIVSGMSGDTDLLGVRWAKHNSIRVAEFPYASEFGRAGGPIRNRRMAKYADVLIAFWDGSSRGTSNMIHEMSVLNKPWHVFDLKEILKNVG